MAAKSISIAVTGNTAPLRKSLTTAEKQLKRFSQQANANMKQAAQSFAVAGAGAVFLASKMNKAFEEMSTANARIVQVSNQMGLFAGQVGVTSDRLIKLARATALQTGVDANSIKMTQAKLLTFAELAKTATTAGGAFDRATQAAIDMGAAGFGEASQNAVQLGKALQDPIKGITALARSGVTFTEQQKEQIRTLVESNRMLEAQDMILSAIEQQVGGTAAATANASDRMREGMRVVKEEIGRGLAPAFEQLAANAVQFGTWAEKNGPIVAALAIGLGSLAVAVFGVKAAMATATAVSAAYALAQTGLAAANIAVQISTGIGIITAAASVAAIATLTKKVYDNAKANRENAAAISEATDAQARLRAIQLDKQGIVPPKLDDLALDYTAVGNAAETAREKERRKFRALKDNLKSAKEALRGYVASISDAITKEVSLAQAFSTAATSQADAQSAVNDALKERAAAYEALDQSRATRDQNAYDDALRRVAAAEQAVTAAQNIKPKDYSAIFAEQIAAAKSFAGYVKQLVQNGLGKAGLAQILELGPVAGAQVAKDLLAGTGGLTIGGLNTDLAAIAAEGTAAGMAIPGMSQALGANATRGQNNTYAITINAGVGDKNEIGRQVVEILQQYNKRVGALPIKVKK